VYTKRHAQHGTSSRSDERLLESTAFVVRCAGAFRESARQASSEETRRAQTSATKDGVNDGGFTSVLSWWRNGGRILERTGLRTRGISDSLGRADDQRRGTRQRRESQRQQQGAHDREHTVGRRVMPNQGDGLIPQYDAPRPTHRGASPDGTT
jgi:hypothetical protein